MIGQEFGLMYLIPIAIEKLRDNILAEGDYYPGDLLKNVLSIPEKFWSDNPTLFFEMKEIISITEIEIEKEGISLKKFKSLPA